MPKVHKSHELIEFDLRRQLIITIGNEFYPIDANLQVEAQVLGKEILKVEVFSGAEEITEVVDADAMDAIYAEVESRMGAPEQHIGRSDVYDQIGVA